MAGKHTKGNSPRSAIQRTNPNNGNRQSEIHLSQQHTEHYEGAVPPPALVEHFQRLVPDAAERFFRMAENEANHRQMIERDAVNANINTQARQIAIAEMQAKASITADKIGLFAGIVISLVCIAACVFLALGGYQIAAAAVIALPTAGLLLALRGRGKPESGTVKK